MWHQSDDKKHKLVLAIPRVVVPELMSLVHAMHEHPGIGGTFIFL